MDICEIIVEELRFLVEVGYQRSDARRGFTFLAVSGVAAGFGNSLEPVSILAILSSSFLILGLDLIFKRDEVEISRPLLCKTVCVVLVSQSFGFLLGFNGIFAIPHVSANSVFITFFAGFLSWCLYIIFAVVPHVYFTNRYRGCFLAVVVYATTHTMVSCVLIGNIFSTFYAVGNAALDYEPLKHVGSLFGLGGINFIVVLIGSSFGLYISNHSLYRVGLKYFMWSLCVVLIIASFIMQSDSVYQVNVNRETATTTPVSCVFAQGAEYESEAYENIWISVANRVSKGDSFVIMSEEALEIKSIAQETSVLEKAFEIANTTSLQEVYIGVTYSKFIGGESMGTNQFALVSNIQPNASQPVWNYHKAHPVPLVESDVRPGDGILPTHNSIYGKLSGAICFDMDYPLTMHQAGLKEVDMLIQPSWTWDAINYRHFDGDAVRAVENGFSYFRCSSEGESGIVNPRGKFLARQYTGADPLVEVTFSLPIVKHVATMYTYFGWIFDWVCLGLSIFIYGVTFLPDEYLYGLNEGFGRDPHGRTGNSSQEESLIRVNDLSRNDGSLTQNDRYL